MQSSVLSSALDATTSKHLTKGERRYPCGFPGCKWIFTRSNHVLRHHQRVHPGYSPSANANHSCSGGGGNSSGNSSNIASISGGNGTSATSSTNSGGGALAATAALTNNNAKDIAIAAVAAAAQAAVSSATDSPVHQTLMQLQQQQMLLSLMSAALPLEQQLLLLSAATAASSPHAASPIAASTCIPSSERKRSALSLLDHTDRIGGDNHREPVSKKSPSLVKNHPLVLTRSVSPLVTSVVLEEDEDDEANQVQTNGSIETDETCEGTTAIEEADDECNDDDADEDRSITPSQTLEPEILLEVDENQEWRPSDEQTVSSSINIHDDSDDTVAIRSVDGSLLSQSLALGSAAVRPRPYICDVAMCDKRYTKHSHLVRHKVETHKLMKSSNNSNHSGSNNSNSHKSNSNSLLNVQSKNCHNISLNKVVPMTSVTTNDSSSSSSSAPVPPPLNLAERPFVCEIAGCRWSFKRQYHLDRHLLTHQESPNRSAGASSGNSSSSSSSNNCLPVTRPLVPISTSIAPSTANVSSTGATSGAIKYACNHPGCGIKVQSETSLEAHVYLTHILSNRNRSNRDQMSSSQSLSLLASLAQRRKQQQQQQQKHQHQLQQQQLAAQQLHQHEAGLPPEGLVGRSYSPPNTQATLLSPISGHSNGSNSSDGISKRGARMEVEKALFTCDMPGCDKRFGRNCELTRHKLNHVDIWPFSCDYPGCNRKFKRKDVFKNHQRTHVKEPSSSSLLPSCVVIEPDSGEL